MEQNWISHPVDAEGTLRLIGINVALSGTAPDKARWCCTSIRIPFKKAGDDGMGDSKERDKIGKLEDAFAAAIEKEIDAVHFASVRGDGAVEFWMYSKGKAEAAIERLAQKTFEGYEVECRTEPDTKWETYWNMLPDSDTMREVADAHLVHFLESQGDDLEKPRPVEHFAAFVSKKGAEKYMKAVEKHEFEARLGPEKGPFIVTATREDPVDMESIHEVTTLLANLAEAEEGEYDGWETRVVKK